MYLHFMAIADAVDIPIIIYNIPPRSVVDMSVETMARLAQAPEHRRREGRDRQSCPPVADARGPAARVLQLSGEDHTALAFLAAGGVGCISVTGNVAPRLCSEMHDGLARRAGGRGDGHPGPPAAVA